MAAALERYDELCAKVEAFAGKVFGRHRADMACRPGHGVDGLYREAGDIVAGARVELAAVLGAGG